MKDLAMLRRQRSRASCGFTLVEIMVTVAIIAILAAVAVPQYTSYVTRGRIPDATSGLATRAVQAEQYFQDNRTYANNGTVTNPGCVSDTTSSKTFNFSCSTATASAFVAQAVGKGSMAGFTYTIDQAGRKATTAVPSGWTAKSDCWVTKKDGTC